MSVVLLLLLGAVPAQARLPPSTQARLATADYLEGLALPDFTRVMSKAQSGDREALKWLRKAAAQALPDAPFSLGQMYEEGECVPESDSMAASWYRKASDHFPEGVGGLWEAEVQLAPMYRQGRLPKDYEAAYMRFAIVGPDVDYMKWAARHMTKAQIAKAERMAGDWTRGHRRQGPTSGDNSLDHAQPAK